MILILDKNCQYQKETAFKYQFTMKQNKFERISKITKSLEQQLQFQYIEEIQVL
ncbi:unnamed protein product [Paramecium octaurelia]|uniref:Uncharacterized protein n=1 Tax=Paramecium octaurelia TaxID=43137 RepID=A0A8S1WVN0_PAROT|nr:unnamed protein product [Paramecium octaurelia]